MRPFIHMLLYGNSCFNRQARSPRTSAAAVMLLALAIMQLSAPQLRAQGVAFAPGIEGSDICTGDAVQTVGAISLTAIGAGSILSGSSVTLTIIGGDLSGTPTITGTGAASLTTSFNRNQLILSFTANVAFAAGSSLRVANVQQTTTKSSSGSVLLSLSALSTSPGSAPITFTTSTLLIGSMVSCNLLVDSGNNQARPVDTVLPDPLVVTMAPCKPGTLVTFTIKSGGGTVTPIATPVSSQCKASTTYRLGAKSGPASITASSAITGTAQFDLTALPGPPTKILPFSGNQQTGPVGRDLPAPIVIRVLDAYENPTPRIEVEFEVVQGGGVLSTYDGLTDADGMMSSYWRMGATPGTNIARVSSVLVPTAQTSFTATATPILPTTLQLNSGNNQTGLPGLPIPPFVVRVVGEGNIPVENVPVTFTVEAGGGTLSATQATTDANGYASSTLTLGPDQSVNVVTARSGSLIGSPVTFRALATASGLAPTLFTGGMVNGASFRPSSGANGSVAPGTIVSIFGSDLASGTAVAQSTPLPTTLLDTTITFDGTPAPLFFVSPTQINAQVPWNVTLGSVAVRVQRGFLEIPSQSFTLTAVSPGIFTTNQTGSGPAAILHAATFEAVTPANPAVPGERLAIFATGLGAVRPAVASGAPAPSPAPTTISSALVNIGGIPAAIEFSGLAPGFVGLYQVNVIVPGGLASGNQDVQLVINGTPSNTVTLAIR
jgi:uncharacterized protein (TIGR03437 family)